MTEFVQTIRGILGNKLTPDQRDLARACAQRIKTELTQLAYSGELVLCHEREGFAVPEFKGLDNETAEAGFIYIMALLLQDGIHIYHSASHTDSPDDCWYWWFNASVFQSLA